MKILIKNRYNHKEEVVTANSLKEARKEWIIKLRKEIESTVSVDDDWEDYYDDYDEALHWTIESLYDQALPDFQFFIIEQ